MTRWWDGLHDAVRDRFSLRRRRRVALATVDVRRRLPFARLLPGALVIGAQRGGTSSLYVYLGRHPDAAASLRKEVGYFSLFYRRGPEWYRAHFPLAARGALHRMRRGRPLLAFEATPEYLLDPRAAARAAAEVPDARIIVLLRDPVDRAWSHWSHMHRRGQERLSFADAVAAEPDRLGDHLARLAAVDPLDRGRDEPLPRPVARYSYLARGRYAAQLAPWLARYPRDRILVVRSEEFYAATPEVFGAVLAFLDLPAWRPAAFHNVSRGGRPPSGGAEAGPDPALRARLERDFFDDNAALFRLVGRDLGWNGRAGERSP